MTRNEPHPHAGVRRWPVWMRLRKTARARWPAPPFRETLSVAPTRSAKAEAGSSGGWPPRIAQRGEQALKGTEPHERRSSRPVHANAKGFDGRARFEPSRPGALQAIRGGLKQALWIGAEAHRPTAWNAARGITEQFTAAAAACDENRECGAAKPIRPSRSRAQVPRGGESQERCG